MSLDVDGNEARLDMASRLIRRWLESIGLARVAQRIEDSGVGADSISRLTTSELEQLGVPSKHHKTLMSALLNEDALADTAGANVTERRQVTVMFCDIAGSTRLSQDLDPEDFGDLIQRYRQVCSRIIDRAGGSVGRFLGDGILAYFGYPQAHEDNAARACRAALSIIDAIKKFSDYPLQVRLACATGLVVIGDMAGEENSIVGAAPNYAAKLQELAEPSTLVVDEDTLAILGESFVYHDLGSVHPRALRNPVRAWRIERERRFESRFAARNQTGLGAILGRQQELGSLLNCWRAAKAGKGQVSWISGEPGIGKSRLVHELRQQIVDQDCATILYQCAENSTSSAFSPVFAELEYAAKIAIDDDPVERVAKLAGLPEGATIARYIAPAMGLSALPLRESDARQAVGKEQVLEVLADRLTRLATQRPVLLIVEDAHWIDPSTKEYIQAVLARIQSLSLLVVITSRPERDSGWLWTLQATRLSVPRLATADSLQIAQRFLADASLAPGVLDTIVARSEGVPLFLEELAKTVVSTHELLRGAGAGSATTVAVPNTLRDSLTARLDMLPTSKEVAQIGAVLGRSFSATLLAHVATLTGARVADALQELVQADLLVLAGRPSDPIYAFKHALVQDAAYESLLRSQRRQLHGRVATVLKQHHPQSLDRNPELLAQHLTAAESFPDAARQWLSAGIKAAERSANQEASIHFEAALAALGKIPLSQRDPKLEIDALLRLAGAFRATRGYAALEVEQACTRALMLARDGGHDAHSLQALNGLYSFHLVRSGYATAETMAQELLKLAIRTGQADYTMIGYRAVGAVSFHLGRLKEAERNLQQALDRYDLKRHAPLATVYGSDHAATCAFFLAKSKWVLGACDEALTLQSWAIEHARSIGHAHSLAQAFAYRSFLYCLAGDPILIEADARSALAVATEHKLKLMEIFSRCTLAVAPAIAEPSLQTADALEAVIDGLHAIAPNALRPYFLAVAANVRLQLGMVEKGLELVDQADAIMQRTSEFWPAAEVGRVRAALLAAKQQFDEADSVRRVAMQTAQEQAAGSWVLRLARDFADREDKPPTSQTHDPSAAQSHHPDVTR